MTWLAAGWIRVMLQIRLVIVACAFLRSSHLDRDTQGSGVNERNTLLTAAVLSGSFRRASEHRFVEMRTPASINPNDSNESLYGYRTYTSL